MCDLTFVLGRGEEADICILANWCTERTRFSASFMLYLRSGVKMLYLSYITK